jgi:hypothetical protein
MKRRSYSGRGLLLFGSLIFLLGAASHAGAKPQKAVLEVDLKNPGDKVAQIVFYLYTPGHTLSSSEIAGITVDAPVGPNQRQNLFPPNTGAVVVQGTKAGDVVKVTLTPIRVYQANQNVKFALTVPTSASIRILNGQVNNNSNEAGAPPAWYNNDGNGPPGTTGTELTPGPKLPGFQVNTKDAAYTAYNDGDPSLGIRNLQFLPNLTQSQFDGLDLDAILAETPGSPIPELTPPWTSATFPNLPDPDPGNYFTAEGQMVDLSGNVVGSFVDAVQTVPEPSPLILAVTGLAGLLTVCRRRRGQKT